MKNLPADVSNIADGLFKATNELNKAIRDAIANEIEVTVEVEHYLTPISGRKVTYLITRAFVEIGNE